MLKGLGCDLIQVSRMERTLEREHFAKRVFTPAERAVIAKKGAATAAGLWAAKEAVSKALGTGFTGFTLQDVEILCDDAGAPHAYLHRGAQARLARLGALTVWVSITHERDEAMAVAAVE
jgi:holo-[acyl-carrier protein] synthase